MGEKLFNLRNLVEPRVKVKSGGNRGNNQLKQKD